MHRQQHAHLEAEAALTVGGCAPEAVGSAVEADAAY
jgi:hypothetical protein